MPELELAFRASESPGWAGWLFAVLMVLLVPAALASRRALERGLELPPPRALYLQTSVLLLVVLGVATLAGREMGLAPWSRPPPPARAWALGGATVLALLAAAVAVWRVTPQEERMRGAAFLPRDVLERALVVVMACLAGLAEELAWRAVLPALLLDWTGNAWLAVAVHALYDVLAVFWLSPYLLRRSGQSP